MDILQELQNRILFCDGGMGSLLQEAELKPGELPGTWNITHPEELVKIHKAYLEAGADIVTTNTFGVDRLKYNKNTEFQLGGSGECEGSHPPEWKAGLDRPGYGTDWQAVKTDGRPSF